MSVKFFLYTGPEGNRVVTAKEAETLPKSSLTPIQAQDIPLVKTLPASHLRPQGGKLVPITAYSRPLIGPRMRYFMWGVMVGLAPLVIALLWSL